LFSKKSIRLWSNFVKKRTVFSSLWLVSFSATMHILLIIDFFPPHRGGVETVFDNITRRLIQRWHQITVVTTRHEKALAQKEIRKKLTIYRVGSTRKNFLRHSYHKANEILKNDKTIDYIHSSTYGAAIPASLLAKKYQKKVILTVHEIFGKLRYRYKGKRSGRLYLLFEKLIFALSYDFYHCVSCYTANSLRVYYGIDDSKIHIIKNGIDDQRSSSTISQEKKDDRQKRLSMTGKYTILYYGHAGKSKGLDFLIEALPQIYQKVPNIQFIANLIPSKRTNQAIKRIEEIQQTWWIDIIIRNGLEQEELKHLVASVDVVIAPSLSEWFGSVVSEVSKIGQNLITTKISAIPEAAFGSVQRIKPSSTTSIIHAVLKASKGEWFSSLQDQSHSRDDVVEKLESIYRQC